MSRGLDENGGGISIWRGGEHGDGSLTVVATEASGAELLMDGGGQRWALQWLGLATQI